MVLPSGLARGDAILLGLWAIPTVGFLGGVFLLLTRYETLANLLGMTMGQELDLDSADVTCMPLTTGVPCAALGGPGGEP